MTLQEWLTSQGFTLLAMKVEGGEPFAHVIIEREGHQIEQWTPVPPQVKLTGQELRTWLGVS